MVGFTNITYLKQGIIDTTSLSEEQRTSALPVLESCFSSTFTLPQINDMKQLSMKSGEGICSSFKHFSIANIQIRLLISQVIVRPLR